MQFSIYQDSLIGARRSNQDRMGYRFTRDALLLVVADGMGGHMRGDVAATLALATLAGAFERDAQPYLKDPADFLQQGFLAAHREIHRYRALHNLPETPRTTIVACVIQHGRAIWAHCGDSRLYLMRAGTIVARTRDHSHLEYLIEEGRIDPSERDHHPDRNKLFNCLGAPAPPDVSATVAATLEPHDVLLLCSDGLWAPLSDDLLVDGLAQGALTQAVPQLLASAVASAGPASDNATALALQWGGDDLVALEPEGEATLTLPAQEFAEQPLALPPSGFEAEFAREFGVALSDTIAPSPTALADMPTETELDQALAALRAGIEHPTRNKN